MSVAKAADTPRLYFLRSNGLIVAVAAFAVVVVLAVAGGLLSHISGSGGGASSGPLDAGSVINRMRLPAAVGQPVTWGFTYVTNPTEEAAVIDKVQIKATDESFVTEVFVAPPGSHAVGGLVAVWPPPEAGSNELVKPTGAVLPPGQTMNVFARLVAPASGEFTAGPLVVDYHIGSNHYQKTFKSYATIMAAG